jgi:glycosyltransferase involved in cell wall biosynthesis
LSDDEVQFLYDTASVVIFPSFYEGFGLPILEGLAAGAPVVARASPLLDEIAAHLAPGPTLASFSDVPDLVATLGRLLQGGRSTGVPLGALVDGEVLNWTGVAARIVHFAVSLLEERSPGKWRRRDRALKLAGMV